MFTVSLVTVEVWVTHFKSQIHELRVVHVGLAGGREAVALCPVDDGPVNTQKVRHLHAVWNS